MKIISPKLHAVLDYLTVIFLLASPSLFSFTDPASNICYLLGGIHLLLTICTNFTGGLFKVIPLRFHGMIEFFVSLLLGITAFTIFRNSMTEQFYFFGLAFVILLVFMLTDYKDQRPS